jgi:hypothetical protein
MQVCVHCGKTASGQPQCEYCGWISTTVPGDRKWPLAVWTGISIFLGALLSLASLLLIGFGMVEEFARVFVGPAIGWMMFGGLALEWHLRPHGKINWVRIGLACVAASLFLFMPLRIWEREHSPLAKALRPLDKEDHAAVGDFLAQHRQKDTPELRKLRALWQASEAAAWAPIARGDCGTLVEYKKAFPNGPHANELANQEDACAWRSAQFFAKGAHRHELANLRRYLAQGPLLVHRVEAQSRIDTAYWELVQEQAGSLEGMAEAAAEYLREVPTGKHGTEARRLVRRVR